MGITLMVAENGLLLQDKRCRHALDNRKAMVFGKSLNRHGAVYQKVQLGTGFAVNDNLFA